MKFIFSILLVLLSMQIMAQDSNSFKFSVGANYGLIMSAYESKILIDPYSYYPQLEVNAGIEGFQAFARLGGITNIGVRTGNSFALVGLSYSYNPFSAMKQNHVVSFEFTFYKDVFKNATLYIYTKHGFGLYSFEYVFSPLNIGLTFRLN